MLDVMIACESSFWHIRSFATKTLGAAAKPIPSLKISVLGSRLFRPLCMRATLKSNGVSEPCSKRVSALIAPRRLRRTGQLKTSIGGSPRQSMYAPRATTITTSSPARPPCYYPRNRERAVPCLHCCPQQGRVPDL